MNSRRSAISRRALIALAALAALLLLRRSRLPVVAGLPELFVVAAASLCGLLLAPAS